jgi:probable HAF family extracellular repeat protein
MLSTQNKFRMLSVFVILALVSGYANVSPVLSLGAATSPAIAQTTPRYSVTELAGIPWRLNNNGQIAGWVFVGPDAHAAIYSNGAWRDLGVPAGDQLSAFFGINSAGAAVGYSFVALPGRDNRWRAMWAPAGATSVETLSALAPDSFAYAINDSGAIVGCLNRYDDVFPDPHRAFLYQGGSVIDLHALLAPNPTYDFTCARDVNNAGIVVGEVQSLSTPPRGFLYRDGAVTLLAQSSTTYLSNAKAVSNAGTIVGEGRLPGFTADHALAYDVATGAITSLGVETTGAFNSRPNDVNTLGDVVGAMFLGVGEHGFLASAGNLYDLNDLIPSGDWVVQEGFSINDTGQIVGRGYRLSSPTVTRYFLLRQDYGVVVAWGDNLYGQSSVPAGLDNVSTIAGGAFHSLALKSDGTVVGWGRDNFGQATVPAGLDGVTAISAGGFHSLALESDGTVVAWGRNDLGQATVPPGLNGVIAISAGSFHSLALKRDGTVVAWGDNGNGQATVPAGLNGVIAIDAGAHSLALKSDGTVVAWGPNFSGQVTVPAGLNGVTAIKAGGSHSMALKSDGTVVAWGDNSAGQSTVPVGLSGVIGIDTGGAHSLALKSDGTVVAWGANFSGQSTVPTGLADVFAIAAGGGHSLALVPPALDTTAPIITPDIVGTLGNNGWYVSDVTISWGVVDNESPVSSQTDCDSTTLSLDTDGTTLTCSATSAGGTTNQSVTVKLDKTAPTVDAGPAVSILEGGTYTRIGTFSDPSAAPWTATVDYGDGSGVQSLALAGNTFTLNRVYTAAGIFTVEVTVTDDGGNVGTTTVEVTVLTPREGTAGLIDQVQSLIAQGTLSPGHGNALIAKLDGVIKQLDRGKTKTAVNELQAFISQVNDLMNSTPPILMPAEGQPLIDAANAIIAALGG